MRILFISSIKPKTAPAYEHRVSSIEDQCRKLGANTSRLSLWKLFFGCPVLIQPLNIPFILGFLRNFDVLVAEGSGPACTLVLAKSLLRADTLLVYDMHNDYLAESRLLKKTRFDLIGSFMKFETLLMEYIGFNGFTYFLAASPGLKQRILDRKHSIKTDNVEVILNGVDLKLFTPQENYFNTNENCFTVAYAGSYPNYQGIENLVKAAEILLHAGEAVHFKFMGFRKNELSIKKNIENRLKDKVTCLERLPKDKLISELHKTDVLISPSASDSGRAIFPVKFGEYLALAKPVIVTCIDETSEIVNRIDCGFVCEPTAESIASAILKAKRTPKKVLHLKGNNGRKFAETELDIKIVCRILLRFLSKLKQKSI